MKQLSTFLKVSNCSFRKQFALILSILKWDSLSLHLQTFSTITSLEVVPSSAKVVKWVVFVKRSFHYYRQEKNSNMLKYHKLLLTNKPACILLIAKAYHSFLDWFPTFQATAVLSSFQKSMKINLQKFETISIKSSLIFCFSHGRGRWKLFHINALKTALTLGLNKV